MKFYRLSEEDIAKLINSGRISMKEELDTEGITIPKTFEVELAFDGQYSLSIEDCMREDNINVDIIK